MFAIHRIPPIQVADWTTFNTLNKQYMETLFWISTLIILYSFAGYGLLITLLNKLKGNKQSSTALTEEDLPKVTLLIAAYNEKSALIQPFVPDKKQPPFPYDHP